MPDYLSCGSCPVDFELADIKSFIEHKRQRCVIDNLDTDQLECIKCSKRFHTPWPLIFHVQIEHQILVVRNLDSISLPSGLNKKVLTPLDDKLEESNTMETDHCDLNCHINYRDMSTQTLKSTSSACCKPINMTLCCKKIEPQCFEEPCACPSNGVFLSDLCYYNCENVPKPDPDSSITCCVCPQPSIKRESREVQTDFESSDDVDINFLLSNQTENSNETYANHIATTFPQQTVPFTTQPYTNAYTLSMEKNWGYFTQADSHINEVNNTRNYLPSYENPNYQIMLNDMRLQTPNNSDYLDPQRLSVGARTPSPNHQHNLNLSMNNKSPVFQYENNCIKEPSMINHSNLFQETNNTFPFGLSTDQEKSNANALSINNHPLINKDIIPRQPLISPNENCSINYFPNQSDFNVDFCNTENLDNEKLDGEKKEFRFLCPNCGKKFRQKVHLRKHVMSQHARQKPHKCSQCGYTTVEKSHLTVHIRTHTGERPYTCRRCSYSSAQNCTLKSHYLRRHPGDQIDCSLCGSFFITEQERNNHQRSCRIVNGLPTTGSSSSNNTDQSELPNNNSTNNNNNIKTA